MTKEIRYTNQNQSTALDFGSAQPAVSGYKKTKLGWIPKEWEVIKLDEVFDFISTNSFSRKELCYEPKENSVYNIHYGDIHSTFNEPILDYQKAANAIPVINDEIPLPIETAHLKNGDIVMADASEDYEGVGATIELSNFNDVKVVAGLHTFALRDKMNKTVEGFRTYVFKHPQVSKSIKVIATGSKVYGISKTNLAKIKLILPPLPEQKKIAAILSTWDKCIALQTELIAAKEQQKKGLMQQLLSGEMRFPGFEDEWEEVKLGEVFEIVGGGTPDTTKDEYWGEDITWFTPTEIKRKYIGSSVRKISKLGLQKSSAKLLPAGTLLFTSRATIADVGISSEKCSTNQGFQSFLPSDSESIEYLYYWILNNKKEFIRRCSGSTFIEISKKEIEKINWLRPSLKEQQKIAAVLSAVDREIALLKQELTALEQQKKGLMQVLLTGEVRVPSV